MQVTAFTCGWLTGDLGGFVAGATGRIRVPVPVYCIEHPRGRVVFDAGLHPDAASDAEGRLGFLASLFEVHYRPGEDVASRLEGIGVDPGRVDHLVLSHLHFDHAGGASLLPDARLVVQRREWEAGADDELAMRCTFDPKDYRLGHDVLLVDGEHDLFGDGRVVCLPTHGHTPGHQSLRLRLDDGREVVLCADACYLRRNLEEMALPGLAWDPEGMMRSYERLASMRSAGAELVFGHDPGDWDEDTGNHACFAAAVHPR